MRHSRHSSLLDSFALGFDMPASMQINRVNKKIELLHCAREKHFELTERRKIWAQNKLRTREKKVAALEKKLQEEQKKKI